MSKYSSLIKYVEARPRKERKGAKATTSVVVAGSVSEEGVSKSYVDSNFVNLTTEQIVEGLKDFVGGIKVNGSLIHYNAENKYWELDGDLIVSGAITMFGSSKGFKPSTITDAVSIDNYTIKKNALGQLYVAVGGTGGTDTATVNALIAEALVPYIKTETADGKFALISTVTGIDTRLSAVETFFATEDSDTLVNKWAEIVDFLNATEGDTLDNILSTKANKATTLAGYGITDAYTRTQIDNVVLGLNAEIGRKWTQDDVKISNWDTTYDWGNHANAGYAAQSYVDTELAKYVKLATAQKIDAQHNFVNGLQIGGLPITKSASANNTIYLDANLVVSGAITMFGNGSTTFPTIWSNIPFNLGQMTWDGSKWSIKDGVAGGGVDVNAVNTLISEALVGYAKILDIPTNNTQLTNGAGYITASALDDYLPKSGGIISRANDRNQLSLMCASGGASALWLNSNFAFTEGGGILQHEGTKGDLILLNFSSYLASYNQTHGILIPKTGGVYIVNAEVNKKYEIIHENNIGEATAGYAKQLATPVTIWGQEFDGSKGISGDAKIDGMLTLADVSWSNQFHIKTSAVAAGIRFYPQNSMKGILFVESDGRLRYQENGRDRNILFENSDIINPSTSTLTINGDLLTTGAITTKSLTIDGLQIYKSQDNTLFIDANLVVSGAITMFGNGSTTFPTIWANIPFNSAQMSWDGSMWSIKDGVASGGIDVNAVNTLISEALVGYAKIIDIPTNNTQLTNGAGYITASALDDYLPKSGGIISRANDRNQLSLMCASGGASALWLNSNFAFTEGGGILQHEGTKGDLILLNFSSYLASYNQTHGILIPKTGGVYIVNAEVNKKYEIIHENNIGEATAGYAKQLATPVTIWGQEFDGSKGISGDAKIDGMLTLADVSWSNQFHIKTSAVAAGIRFYPQNSMKGILFVESDGRLRYQENGRDRNILFENSDIINPSTSTLTINGNLLTTGAITTKSLTIDGLQLYKSQDKTLFIDGNVVVSGAITMFGTNATQVAENLEQRVAELERKVTQLTA